MASRKSFSVRPAACAVAALLSAPVVFLSLLAQVPQPQAYTSWRDYGGSADSMQDVAFCASGSAKEELPVEKAFEALPGASAQGYYVFALPKGKSSAGDASSGRGH